MLSAVTSSENPDAGKHATGGAWTDDVRDEDRTDSAVNIPTPEGDPEPPVVALRRLSPAAAPTPPPRPQASGDGRWGAQDHAGDGDEPFAAASGDRATPQRTQAPAESAAQHRDRPVPAVPDQSAAEHTVVVNTATRSAMSTSDWARERESEPRGRESSAAREYERDGFAARDRARDDFRGGEIRYSPPPPAVSGGFGDGLASEFRSEQFATEVQPEPHRGWRRVVLKSSFGLINPGESRVEREDRERIEQIRANIRGQFIFAVFSPRGGVAKTTTTAALGSMFSSLRGSEVLALDADPDSGNLAGRINDDTSATFLDILRDRDKIRGVTDVRAYTAHNADKLDVLASSKDLVRPAVYTPATLFDTVEALRGSYRVIAIDCGKRMRDPLTEAVLDMVSALVVVTSSQYDSAKAAMSFHDYLRNTGRGQLLERSFLIISDRNPVGAETKAARKLIEDHVRNVVWKDPIYVPYDPHLHEGTTINLSQLKRPSYRAYLEATARLSSWYGMPPVPRGRR